MEYRIRRVTAEDWRELRRLRLEALKDSPLAYLERYDESVAQPDRFWQDRAVRGATSEAHAMYVADLAGRFVGQAGGFVDPEVTDRVSVEVVAVYVTPESRGTGVAEALMAAVLEWARAEAGADRIGLYVVDVNERAAAFYRRLGFVQTGHTLPYPHDPQYTEIQLELPTPNGPVPPGAGCP